MKLAIILLAAGKSERFGGVKLVQSIGQESMINAAITIYQQIPHYHFSVVLGANSDLIKKHIQHTVTTVQCTNWLQGMSASIKSGIKAMPEGASHVLIALSDQVAITAKQIRLLVANSKQSPDQIIAAKYHNQSGVPVIFPRKYFTSLCELQGDKGARELINNKKNEVLSVNMESAGFDIDTKDELSLWLSRPK